MDQIAYREMRCGEEQAVCELVRQVFDELVASDYGTAGVEEFFRFANPTAMAARVEAGGFVLVASASGNLVGMLEFVPPDRISMLFVSLPHQGIAKKLLARTIRRALAVSPPVSKLTVHSSPYAEPIYRKMGFNQIGDLTTEHGITYIPMELDLRSYGSLTQILRMFAYGRQATVTRATNERLLYFAQRTVEQTEVE